MGPKSDSHKLGAEAFLTGKKRAPMGDHAFVKTLQTKHSGDHHPGAPGVDMSEAGRRRMEKKLNEWCCGWDEERAKT